MKFLSHGSVAVSLLAATLVQAAPAAEKLMARQNDPTHPECPTGFSLPSYGSRTCTSDALGMCALVCSVRPQCINGHCCVSAKDGGVC